MLMVILKKNDRGFPFAEISAKAHGHVKTRLWIHHSLYPGRCPDVWEDWSKLDRSEEFFPSPGRIVRTERGSLVLRPAAGWTTYLVRIPSGYRGTAAISDITGPDVEIMAEGKFYHSPQGRCGETAWALISARGPVVVTGSRTGRRIDPENEGLTVRYTPDGEMEELVADREVCELLED